MVTPGHEASKSFEFRVSSVRPLARAVASMQASTSFNFVVRRNWIVSSAISGDIWICCIRPSNARVGFSMSGSRAPTRISIQERTLIAAPRSRFKRVRATSDPFSASMMMLLSRRTGLSAPTPCVSRRGNRPCSRPLSSTSRTPHPQRDRARPAPAFLAAL